MVSGWLAAGYASRNTGLTQTISKQARSLLLPYVTFYLLGYAYWLLTRNIGEKAARWGSHPWWEPIVAMFTGIGPDLYVQPPLWFLPVMLATVVSYLVLRRLMSPILIAGLALIVAWFWMNWFPAQYVRIFRFGRATGVAVLLRIGRLADLPFATPADIPWPAAPWQRSCWHWRWPGWPSPMGESTSTCSNSDTITRCSWLARCLVR